MLKTSMQISPKQTNYVNYFRYNLDTYKLIYNLSLLNMAQNLRAKAPSFISFQLKFINFLLDLAQTHQENL